MPRRHKPPSVLTPPSSSDSSGVLYVFTEKYGMITKIGRTNCPLRRKKDWAKQCNPVSQEWVYCWKVPYAQKFESLVHAHFKYEGAWLRPPPCSGCFVRHREKFDTGACGGLDEIACVVEDYLRQLGWRVTRFCLDLHDYAKFAPATAAGSPVNILIRSRWSQRVRICDNVPYTLRVVERIVQSKKEINNKNPSRGSRLSAFATTDPVAAASPALSGRATDGVVLVGVDLLSPCLAVKISMAQAASTIDSPAVPPYMGPIRPGHTVALIFETSGTARLFAFPFTSLAEAEAAEDLLAFYNHPLQCADCRRPFKRTPSACFTYIFTCPHWPDDAPDSESAPNRAIEASASPFSPEPVHPPVKNGVPASPLPPVACLDTKRNQSGSTPHCGEPTRSQRVPGQVEVGKPKRIGDEGQDREHQGRVGPSFMTPPLGNVLVVKQAASDIAEDQPIPRAEAMELPLTDVTVSDLADINRYLVEYAVPGYLEPDLTYVQVFARDVDGRRRRLALLCPRRRRSQRSHT
ncbi:hypothetical protein C8F01DRAFT_1085017 [Mycena amicta]|nr:hypothetical protein C8F01DRAFT_1085017 [Mycena amicta]